MKPPVDRSFLDHLRELRTRLIRIVIVLLAFLGAGIWLTPELLKMLIAPYGNQLKVIGPTEGVSVYLQVSLACAAAAALPYMVMEIWGFVAPALFRREKAMALVIIPASIILFVAGAGFAWFLLIPAAIGFLATFGPEVFKVEWTSQNYVPFVTSLLFWIGLCFETPLLVFFLARLRVVSARLLLRFWRLAVIGIVIVASVITPTIDPFNLALVALPLVALYFLSILVAALARRRDPKEGTGAGEGI